MEKSNIVKLLKGVLLGGFFALCGLFSLIYFFSELTKEPLNYFTLFISSISLITFSLLTVWATGFWGRWGMVLFFVLVPAILIIDYAINPIFPSGVIVVASLLYGFKAKTPNK